jgi:predicted tellurium resistance membrane protein TerC
MEILATPAFWLSLTALTFLEIVLGIDNLLFVSIAIGKLKGKQQKDARRFGVWGAMVLRILMLAGIFWIIQLDEHPLFHLPAALPAMLGMTEHVEEFIAFTVKDLILLGGGLFLLVKGTQGHAGARRAPRRGGSRIDSAIIVQLAVIRGWRNHRLGTDLLPVMILACRFHFGMAVAAEPLASYIEKHPTMKMLALAFILLVGVALIADGLGFHIPRGYLYFAIAFSLAVELLNIRSRSKAEAAAE